MRRLKFRAWDKKNRLMVEDLTFSNQSDTWYYGTEEQGLILDDDWDVLQSTGFSDKNDREIFEGDILRCLKPGTFDQPVNLVVTFDSPAHPGIIMLMAPNNHCPFALMADENVTVVGDIYQNPMLLIPSQIIVAGNA